MDQHDQLVAAVINSNNEYKDMKNRLKEMEREARMQNDKNIKYKNSVDRKQNENEKYQTEGGNSLRGRDRDTTITVKVIEDQIISNTA